jgi:hypothetical protein
MRRAAAEAATNRIPCGLVNGCLKGQANDAMGRPRRRVVVRAGRTGRFDDMSLMIIIIDNHQAIAAPS